MQEWITIYKVIRAASRAILSRNKKYNAFLEAKDYLADKYYLHYEHQTLNYVDDTETNYMFGDEWWEKLVDLLRQINNSYSYDRKVAELCADSYSFIYVLDYNHLSKYRNHNNKLLKSKIYTRLNKLAEGLGSDVLLKIIQEDLEAFFRKEL